MVGVEVPFTPVSSVEDAYVLFSVISTFSYVQSRDVKKRYLGSVPPKPPLAPALLVEPAYWMNGWPGWSWKLNDLKIAPVVDTVNVPKRFQGRMYSAPMVQERSCKT